MLTIDTNGPFVAQIIRTQLSASPGTDLNALAQHCPDFDAQSTKFAHLHSLCGALFFHDGSVLQSTTQGLRCGRGRWQGHGGYEASYHGGCWHWGHLVHPGGSVLDLGQGSPRPPTVAQGILEVLTRQGRAHTPALREEVIPRRVDAIAMRIVGGLPGMRQSVVLLDDGSYVLYDGGRWVANRGTLYVTPRVIADWVGDSSGFYWALAELPGRHTSRDLVRILAALRAEPLRGEVVRLGKHVA